MTKHSPDRVHWRKVLAIIDKATGGFISAYDLAGELELDKGDINLEVAINQLKRQGKIKEMIGSFDGVPNRILQSLSNNFEGKRISKRDSILEDEDEENE